MLGAGLAAVALALDPALPPYEPEVFEPPRDVVQVVGYNDMRDILEPMRERLEALHPGYRIHFDLPGTRFAPAALAEGRSAFAPMGAEFTPAQLTQYRAVVGVDPVAIRVAHASLDPRALSGPLAVFVHRDNPIASLTLPQLARAFAGEARTWGDLGAGGSWKDRPLHAVGMKPGTALAYAFQDRVLGGRGCDPTVSGLSQSVDVVKRVAEDPVAIGFAAAMRETAGVKALALGDPAVALSIESVQSGRWPLDRHLLIYVKPPVAPHVRAFVRFALSREGQAIVAASPQGYLPLTAPQAAEERAKLP